MEPITQPIVFENIKPDNQNKDSDDSSDDSDYYFHKLVNPTKTISLNDINITKLKQELESLNKTIDDKEEMIEIINKKNLDYQKNFKLINDSINFLNLDYNMNGIELNLSNISKIDTYKKQILSKAFEFAEITKQYNNLVSNYEQCENRFIGNNILHDFFLPLIHQKYNHLKNIYINNNNYNNNGNILWYGFLVFIILVIFFQIVRHI